MLLDPHRERLDCYAEVVTPENIAFEYALAGPFQRFPAWLADLVLRWIVFAAVAFLLAMGLAITQASALWPLYVFFNLVGMFLLSWFYGIFFETYFNGRTPGKAMFKLRVIGMDGRPINALQAALRNLLRIADMFVMLSIQVLNQENPPGYVIPTMLVGFVTMVMTSRMQRIGDLAAGTMVVSEKRKVTPLNQPPDDIRAFGLSDLIPPTYQVGSSLAQAIGLYMENRKRLSLGRREEIAGKVARPLLRQFEMQDDTSADLFLCALYVRTYLTDQQRAEGLAAMRERFPHLNSGMKF